MNACAPFILAIEDVALGAAPSSELAAHLATCAECAAQLERKRVLAQRIDLGIRTAVRAQSPLGLAERIAAGVPSQRHHRRRAAWIGVPAAIALAAALVIFISSLGRQHAPVTATDISTLTTWRSPTASLLHPRGDILSTPFSLRSST